MTQNIQKEFERAAIEAIESAARVFAQQAGPPQFTCALQAKFLNNVVQEYYGVCRRRIPRSASNQRTPTSTTIPYADVAPPMPVVDVPMASDGPYDRPPMLQRPATVKRDPLLSSNFYTRAGGTTVAQSSPDIVPRINLARPPTNGTNYSGSYSHSQGSPSQGPSPSSWTHDPTQGHGANPNQHFTDQDWTSLFMNAGFDIGDGVFVPYDR